MSSFQPPTPGLEPWELEPPDIALPPWLGAPAGVVPGVAPVELLLLHSDVAAVAVGGVRAYPTGVRLTLSAWSRDVGDRALRRAFRSLGGLWDLDGDDATGADALGFGVRFADGRTATTLDDPAGFPGDQQPSPQGPVLRPGSGEGANSSSRASSGSGPCRRRGR
jgi:hypothetical protein